MEGERLERFKEKLIEKQRSLAAMVVRTEGYGREKDTDIQDVADMAVESYTKEFIFGKSSGDRKLLLLIRQALDRIEDSTYGVCVHCEEPIHPKRLEAVPWAQYCIRCQELLEKGLLHE